MHLTVGVEGEREGPSLAEEGSKHVYVLIDLHRLRRPPSVWFSSVLRVMV
jgi:hypothetical protein